MLSYASAGVSLICFVGFLAAVLLDNVGVMIYAGAASLVCCGTHGIAEYFTYREDKAYFQD